MHNFQMQIPDNPRPRMDQRRMPDICQNSIPEQSVPAPGMGFSCICIWLLLSLNCLVASWTACEHKSSLSSRRGAKFPFPTRASSMSTLSWSFSASLSRSRAIPSKRSKSCCTLRWFLLLSAFRPPVSESRSVTDISLKIIHQFKSILKKLVLSNLI